jgi:hypothetical protein
MLNAGSYFAIEKSSPNTCLSNNRKSLSEIVGIHSICLILQHHCI